MKPSILLFRLFTFGVALALSRIDGSAVTFTNDTTIGINDTNFDGAPIVVTNCVLTVDGWHTFKSLSILDGGVLTHSFSKEGYLQNVIHVSAESHIMAGLDPVQLNLAPVAPETVVVRNDSGGLVYSSLTDYQLVQDLSGVTSLLRIPGSSIPDGGGVLVDYDQANPPVPVGVNLNISNEVSVAAGGRILANGIGYGGTYGPGSGWPSGGAFPVGTGGGHGGYGGQASDPVASIGLTYDQSLQPMNPGSGGGAGVGGPGGAGGGAIRLTAGGALQINGTISANGADATNSRSGGGAGGGIWLTASLIVGSGTVSACGGAGEPTLGGGGGGGRIALSCPTNQFVGAIQAYGGIGFQNGGAGTVYSKTAENSAGLLTVDNGTRSGAATELICDGAPDLLVTGNALVQLPGGQALQNLWVRSNCWLFSPNNPTLRSLTVKGNATFENGGGIDLRGQGPSSAQGPGSGTFSGSTGGGGGHAGLGGAGGPIVSSTSSPPGRGGTYYDGVSQPTSAGSGGGGSSSYRGGAGGGAVKLTVLGTLMMDGIISVDGQSAIAPGAGGGSGGSIWLNLGTLAGSGLISARGGSAIPPYGGGGSGGRIALYCDANQFTGSVFAYGGSGYEAGAAGTIYTKIATNALAGVLLDNNGLPGASTALTASGVVDLTVRQGALAVGWTSFHDLNIGSGGRFNPTSTTPANVTITVLGDATISSGGSLSLNGLGYPSSSGNGAGHYYSSSVTLASGSGAGHGGYGGNSAAGSPSAAGGMAYGSVSNPTLPGSGGGGQTTPSLAVGGAGGGSLRLTVSGALRIDGQLSADGLAGAGNSAGGGSGGSLWLNAGEFSGSGVISADGGSGDLPYGGGGGGGQIAIYYTTSRFAGTITAKGGSGYAAGGAGTVYLKTVNGNYAQLIADNGGLVGTNTILNGITSVDLTLRGGASIKGLQNGTIRNLVVGSNSWLSTGTSTETWRITGNATIQPGGRISADGMGYNYSYSGEAHGRYYSNGSAGGGGGHGGFGGNGAAGSLSPGGRALPDPPLAPYPGGNGGIFYYTALPDGAGGGALNLTVSGLLTVDGRLSSDGNSSILGGDGGGAGGGLQLSVGGLAGAGVISAIGGRGDLPNGGGGGGGCVSVNYQSNLFAGTMSVKGGAGFSTGGAGIICLKQNNKPAGQYVVDNEGQHGTNTLVFLPGGNPDILVKGGGSLAFMFSPATLGSLIVESNSLVFVTNQLLTVLGDAAIRQGAAIIADGTGYGPGSGPGRGVVFNSKSGGASHGGMGGANPVLAYGNLQQPRTAGSGGANASGGGAGPYGGAGGGIVGLSVTGTLVLDGVISANGLAGAANSGGGAGGSVWLTVGKFAGSGVISARGGAGNGTAGGGGGGRIALNYTTNRFMGTVSAFGGAGSAPGGAGTIYLQANSDPLGQLAVDNGGLPGANTPVSISSPLDLIISGGAVVHPSSASLLLNSLSIGSSSSLTVLPVSTNLDLAVVHDVVVQPGGTITVDGKGYPLVNGPGAGLSASGYGSGGGYGGPGGASATIAGGLTYGSPQTPAERGSGGGAGGVSTPGGSEGGGAIRLSVGGSLILEGTISANGNPGLEDNSGGGSGGSIWATASSFSGSGQILAEGGSGELLGGGGGGGGRISLYWLDNQFHGAIAVSGGSGFVSGGTGSVFTATYGGDLQILGQTPIGTVSNGVNQIDLTFNAAVDPASFSTGDIRIVTPNGLLDQTNCLITSINSTGYRIAFPQQTALGDYSIQVGPSIQDLLGFSMSQAYTGAFAIALPTIRGVVIDTNGMPVPDVLIQPDGPVSPGLTDVQGQYTIGAPPGTLFSIAPAKTGFYFIPGSRSYTNVDSDLTAQDYLAVPSLMGELAGIAQGTNLLLRCYGYSGVGYQVLSSTNFVDWLPYSDWLPGTNGPVEVLIPLGPDPMEFFRIQARN